MGRISAACLHEQKEERNERLPSSEEKLKVSDNLTPRSDQVVSLEEGRKFGFDKENFFAAHANAEKIGKTNWRKISSTPLLSLPIYRQEHKKECGVLSK